MTQGLTTDQLLGLLAQLGEQRIYSYRWDNVRALVVAVADGSATVLEKEWADAFDRNHRADKLDLGKLETWSTYDHPSCVELDYAVVGGRLQCAVRISDGDRYDGRSVRLRFTATIQVADAFATRIAGTIERAWQEAAERAFADHEEQKRQRWLRRYQLGMLRTVTA